MLSFCRVFALCKISIAAVLLAGCSIISSDSAFQLQKEGRAPNGLYYALPEGRTQITLKADTGNASFILTISDPIFLPDPNYRYLVRHRPLPNFEDDLKISLHPGTQFLKSIESQSLDRTNDIVVNLAKAVSAFGGFETGAGGAPLVTVHDVLIDPTNARHVRWANTQLTLAMTQFARHRAARCSHHPAELTADNGEAYAKSESHCAFYGKVAAGSYGVTIRVTRLATAGKYQTVAAQADCSVGVCYRPLEPYKVQFTVAGVTDTKILDLPNRAPVIAIDFRRALFVNKIKNVTFDKNGILRRVHITKPSEILAATKIPLAVAGAIAAGLQLRIDYVQKNIDVAESNAERIKTSSDAAVAEATRRAGIIAASSSHAPPPDSDLADLVTHNAANSQAASYLPKPASARPAAGQTRQGGGGPVGGSATPGTTSPGTKIPGTKAPPGF